MDIVWLGHSCFRIRGKETTIVTDPPHPDVGYSTGKLQADLVSVSHDHSGHNHVEAVAAPGRVLNRPGEYEVRDVLVTAFNSFHDASQGKERGGNLVFLFEFEGVTLCHLGDIGHVPGPQIMAELSKLDVLFVPVGGFSTLPVPQAAEIMRHLSPKLVIPMHYRTEATRRQLEPLDRFLKEAGAGEKAPQPRLTVNRASLPATTQIAVLSWPQK